jgi:hypothetical protein
MRQDISVDVPVGVQNKPVEDPVVRDNYSWLRATVTIPNTSLKLLCIHDLFVENGKGKAKVKTELKFEPKLELDNLSSVHDALDALSKGEPADEQPKRRRA